MRIAMIGSGYVGLVSGACFSDFGHEVVCVDKSRDKIESLRGGIVPLHEPGLRRLVEKNVKQGRLSFSTELGEAVEGAEIIFIAVGTPARRGDGHADVDHVLSAARDLAPLLSGYCLIVTKSTVPVGTGDEVERILREANPDADFEVASNPEFLREGAAIEDFKRPDRIVAGADSERAIALLRELYRPLYLNETPLIVTDRRTAELAKYASNAFLAVKIGFINEIADLCEKTGADVQQIARVMGLDNRIGSKFLHAGPGYGGSCFPKDTLALTRSARDFGVECSIVEAASSANEKRKSSMASRIADAVGGDLSGKVIGLLGLSFKPNTDDMREAPSVSIARGLIEGGASVRAFDPEAMEAAKLLLPEVIFCRNVWDCLEGCDCAVIVTEWDQFRALDLERVADCLSDRVLIDLRNIYSLEEVRGKGLSYVSVGRLPPED